MQPDVVIEDATFQLDADVATFAAVDRLRVEALLAVGGPMITDTDDDSVAAAQVPLLTITENYQFTGAAWNRVQGRAYGVVGDERLMHTLSRSAIMGHDPAAVAGTQELPVAARNADAAADYAETLIGLLVNARLAAYDNAGPNYEILHAAGIGSRGESLGTRGLMTFSAIAAWDKDAAAPNVIGVLDGPNADADDDFAKTLYGLVTNSRMAGYDSAATNWKMAQCDAGGKMYANILTAVTMAAPATFNVTNASQVVLAANANRKLLLLSNPSSNPIYIAFGNPAVVGSGIFLAANTGTLVLTRESITTGDVRAISTVAGPSVLCIQEAT
jgi:predicted flap endonuclease-1-like 5' DNA nuclease